jgi:two-component system, cell cycle sensor histidine kinase PleC
MGAAAPYRILIADDEPSILNAYSSVLLADAKAKQGDAGLDDLEAELFGDSQQQAAQAYELQLCQQGQQAVAAVKAAAAEGRPFSVAFLDVRMPPGINGVETAKEIRSIDPGLNIVFVTGYSDTDPRDMARIVPPVERLFYVAKPFQPLELQQFASALSNKWRAEQDLLVAHELLKQQYAQLQTANAELSRAKQKAEAASRMKTEFLANVSHELRTPLNSIIGFSEMINNEAHGAIGNDKYSSYVRDIHASGQHLLGVVNDILDISKIEVGEFELQEDQVDVAETIETSLRIVHERAASAGITVTADVASTLPALRGDARRVRQILLNLLSNSIKFTGSGGKVLVRAAGSDDGGITVSVADSGIGIAAEDIEKAMMPFGQVDGRLNRKYEGTGLGLPLAKSLTELHDGRLTLKSAVGKGTTVTLDFPAARVA